jgi:hypothetical protein
MYTPSCKYWVLSPDTVLPLGLQPDSGSSCNWYTLRVANTECFRLILYYPLSCNWYTVRVTNTKFFRLILYNPFSCNRIVVWVAIDAHSELQILSAFVWYYTTPQLQPGTGSSCNWYTLWVVNTECFRLILYYPFVPLQLGSGSSCNWYTLQLANTKCFRLILYYPFSCNRILVRDAIDVHHEL